MSRVGDPEDVTVDELLGSPTDRGDDVVGGRVGLGDHRRGEAEIVGHRFHVGSVIETARERAVPAAVGVGIDVVEADVNRDSL
jgi:hypothetical protein